LKVKKLGITLCLILSMMLPYFVRTQNAQENKIKASYVYHFLSYLK